MTEKNIPVEFKVLPNGPLRAKGKFSIIDNVGNVIEINGVFDFCRCGLSKIKPKCDGSHCKK